MLCVIEICLSILRIMRSFTVAFIIVIAIISIIFLSVSQKMDYCLKLTDHYLGAFFLKSYKRLVHSVLLVNDVPYFSPSGPRCSELA